MKLLQATTTDSAAESGVLAPANDVDPRTLDLQGVSRIDLHFPKFTDGRAYTQAYMLRRRLGYTGELRATGDVLIDQLLQMRRGGFDSAVLRADQNFEVAVKHATDFRDFYQGDAVTPLPAFARGANL
jgi:uncharacterized protein (DUF934 family)